MAGIIRTTSAIAFTRKPFLRSWVARREIATFADMHPFTVVTFNIRYDTDSDGRYAWPNRRSLALKIIRDHDPDLLGIQEATDSQRHDLSEALPEWLSFGTTRATDYPVGFARSARFEMLRNGEFWLSDTPDVPDSITWPNDGGARRCCWALLRDQMLDRVLVFASTHFDTNAGAWLPSATVLASELEKVAGTFPVVVAGDFNCAAGSAAHRSLCAPGRFRDAWNEAGHGDEGVITFNGFTRSTSLPAENQAARWWKRTSSPVELFGHYTPHIRAHKNDRIDWILLRGATMKAVSAENDYRSEHGLMPSDHFPVAARIEWSAEGSEQRR